MLDTGFGRVGKKVPILTSKLFEKHREEGAYSLSVLGESDLFVQR